jgi:hypothetical protein
MRNTRNQRLDIVEGSTPSKTEKTAHIGEAGNVEAPVPTTTERINRTLSGVARDKRTKGGSGGSGWRVITATLKKSKR